MAEREEPLLKDGVVERPHRISVDIHADPRTSVSVDIAEERGDGRVQGLHVVPGSDIDRATEAHAVVPNRYVTLISLDLASEGQPLRLFETDDALDQRAGNLLLQRGLDLLAKVGVRGLKPEEHVLGTREDGKIVSWIRGGHQGR